MGDRTENFEQVFEIDLSNNFTLLKPAFDINCFDGSSQSIGYKGGSKYAVNAFPLPPSPSFEIKRFDSQIPADIKNKRGYPPSLYNIRA